MTDRPTRMARRLSKSGAVMDRVVGVRFDAEGEAGLAGLAARWSCSPGEAVRRLVSAALEQPEEQKREEPQVP